MPKEIKDRQRDKHKHKDKHKQTRKRKREKREKREKHGTQRDEKLAKQRDQQHDKREKRLRGQDGSSSRSRKRQREQREQLVDPSAGEIDTLQDRAKMLERDRLFLREDPRAAQPSTALTDDGALSVSSLFLDTKGDFDTLAFGCQFAAHVPKYRVLAAPREDRYVRYFGPGFGRGRGGGGGGGGAGPMISAEALRRMQPHVPVGNEALAELLPLLPEPLRAVSGGSGDAGAGAAGLLMDDEFVRVRELNAATRQRPQDEDAWLALARTLDGTIGGGGGGDALAEAALGASTGSAPNPHRRHAAAAAERKAEVLRRAVESNPASERLRLALLAAVEACSAHEEVDAEWEAALAALPGSVVLWSAFLARTGRSFGAYSVNAQRHLATRSV